MSGGLSICRAARILPARLVGLLLIDGVGWVVVPPLLVILALLVGGSLGGILGALVAIPLAGALRVLVLRVAVPAVCRWSESSRPIYPSANAS
jgi:hypothetical protein